MYRYDSESSRPGLGRKSIKTRFQAILNFPITGSSVDTVGDPRCEFPAQPSATKYLKFDLKHMRKMENMKTIAKIFQILFRK